MGRPQNHRGAPPRASSAPVVAQPEVEPEAEAEVAEEPEAAVYFVAKRHGVGTARGVIGQGGIVHETDFPAGMARILDLVSAGYLAKR